METNTARGHLAALLTIVIWGTTFISTKVLLEDFQPVEILFIRFVMGYLALWIACPRRLRGVTRRQEGSFALAGLCGVCLYYLLENIALTYTMASNVGVIISVSPCFTALLTHFLMRGEDRLRPTFFAGFAVAMAGICLISFNGSALALDLRGDLLALLAAFVWACYALLTRKIGALGHPTVLTTRRTFFYGLVFMLPALALSGARPDLARLLDPVVLRHLERGGAGAGGSADQRVHLPGAGDHGGGFGGDPGRALHLDDRGRDGADAHGPASLGRQIPTERGNTPWNRSRTNAFW